MPDGKHNELAGEMLPPVKTRSYKNLRFIIAPLEALTKPETLAFHSGLFSSFFFPFLFITNPQQPAITMGDMKQRNVSRDSETISSTKY